jgi:hypothetical protein
MTWTTVGQDQSEHTPDDFTHCLWVVRPGWMELLVTHIHTEHSEILLNHSVRFSSSKQSVARVLSSAVNAGTVV